MLRPESEKIVRSSSERRQDDNLQGLRKMFSTQLLIMIVMLVFLVITCHWCQARKLIVKKMSVSRKSVSGKIESEDYDVLAMV